MKDNAVLNPDRTRKCIISVSYDVWLNDPQADQVNDIFVENAPPIPEGMHTPQLSVDGAVWVEANQAARDAELFAENLKRIEDAIDAHVNATAKEKGYNSTESCLSYIGDANPQWDAEAVAFKAWRSQCWEYVIAEQAKIDAGTRTVPTPEEAVAEIELLYPMVWP